MTNIWGQFGEIRAISPLFMDQEKGYYVDVGALDGVFDSNTVWFERHLGWTGICIEPHRKFYPKLVKNRPNSICLDVAVWDEELDSVDFYATEKGGWSRVGSPGDLPIMEVQHPSTKTLDQILEEHNAPAPLDFLSIDVEGTEEQVLNKFNLDRYLPRVAIIEDMSLKGQFDELFAKRGYDIVHSWEVGQRGSNCIYCRDHGDIEIVRRRW